MNRIIICILLTSLLAACAPQATPIPPTPTEVVATATSIPAISTLVPTSLPTDTPLPTSTPSPVPPSCAMPLNPIDNATVPASGPFDFTWTAFEGAASYVIAIGPKDWLPTNFPITGTTLTRYMEVFPGSPSYQWTITVLNSSGQEICRTRPYAFVTSADQYATPSFSYSDPGMIQPTATDPSNSQESDPSSEDPHQGFKFGAIVVNEGYCEVAVGVSITTKYPVESAIMRYTFDPNEANSPDFCNWGNAFGLGAVDSELYGGHTIFLDSYMKNGDVIYLKAKFVYAQGTVSCSQLVQYTITSCTEK